MDKMLKKRIIAAILCLACVAFSGCSNNAGSSQSESTQSGSAQSSFTEKSQIEPSKEVSQVSETTELSKEESQVSENSKTNSDTNSSDAGSSNATSSKTESSKAESSKISETSKTGQNSQQSQSNKTEESSKSSQTSKPAENSQSSQNSNSGQTSQTSKPAETSKPSKPAETSTVPQPSQSSKPTVVNVSSISLNKSSLTLTVGESSKLTATISPSNATDKGFSWNNSNSGVVSIDGNGNVKALKAGTVTITAKTNNGKTAVCNITVKAKEVSQPTKKKVTYLNLFNDTIIVGSNETTGSMLCDIYPRDADISDLKVVFTKNPNNLVSYQKITKENTDNDSTTYRLHFNIKSRNKDCVAQATISCGGFSETLYFRIQTKYDESLKAYYPPYDIDQIVKDMREYGENLGMEWYEPFYVKWYDNFSRYERKGSFFFPVSTGVNGGVTGINLKDALFGSIREPHETLGGSYTSMYFKVVPVLNEKANEWEFYVLYG